VRDAAALVLTGESASAVCAGPGETLLTLPRRGLKTTVKWLAGRPVLRCGQPYREPVKLLRNH
jgi:hypothetical protein